MNDMPSYVDNLSTNGKSAMLWRINRAMEFANEAGLSARDLDGWLDSKQALDLPDFAWYAVYAVQKAIESLEGMEN